MHRHINTTSCAVHQKKALKKNSWHYFRYELSSKYTYHTYFNHSCVWHTVKNRLSIEINMTCKRNSIIYTHLTKHLTPTCTHTLLQQLTCTWGKEAPSTKSVALHFNAVLDGDSGLVCQLKFTQKMRVKGSNDEGYIHAPTLCMLVSNTLIQKCHTTHKHGKGNHCTVCDSKITSVKWNCVYR